MASNRHLGRIVAMQTLYEHDFRGGDTSQLELSVILERNLDEFRSSIDDTNFVEDVVDGVHMHQADIDAIIGPAAPEWPRPGRNKHDCMISIGLSRSRARKSAISK